MANPEIKWKTIAGREFLCFEFKGSFLEAEARVAVNVWRKEFASKPGQKIDIVWHCLEMKTYDSESRRLWQDAIMEMKNQMGDIWLVTRSPFIKIGGNFISMFTRFNVITVSSEDEIK